MTGRSPDVVPRVRGIPSRPADHGIRRRAWTWSIGQVNSTNTSWGVEDGYQDGPQAIPPGARLVRCVPAPVRVCTRTELTERTCGGWRDGSRRDGGRSRRRRPSAAGRARGGAGGGSAGRGGAGRGSACGGSSGRRGAGRGGAGRGGSGGRRLGRGGRR